MEHQRRQIGFSELEEQESLTQMDVFLKVLSGISVRLIFEILLGTFDAERIKQGQGTFIWMKTNEEDETSVEKARYEGNYKDGNKCGVGKMIYPNGDIYEGEWLDNKVTSLSPPPSSLTLYVLDARRRDLYLQ
jgi:hypothetical protein